MINLLGKVDVSTQAFRDFLLVQYGIRMQKCLGLTESTMRHIGDEKVLLNNYKLRVSGYCYAFKGAASWETIELNQDGTVLLPNRNTPQPSKELVEYVVAELASKGMTEDEVRDAFMRNSEEVARLEIDAIKKAHTKRMHAIATVIPKKDITQR